ncbi:MAG: hypothetical protein IT459_03755 [Planctomycetes bacterium]|nr:hypothetical protein [Planctomycetota bacterium]
MLTLTLALATILAPLASGTGPAKAGRQAQVNFTFSAPAGWERLPVGLAEEGLRARWVDRNPATMREPESGWTDTTRARLDLYVFPGAGSPDAQTAEREHAGYLAWTRFGRCGRRVEVKADEKETIGALGTQSFHGEFVVYKSATRMIEARSFDVGEDRVVLHFEGLISQREELEKLLADASASFRVLQPGQKGGLDVAPPRPVAYFDEVGAADAPERRKALRELGLAARDWSRRSVPAGWKAVDEGPALVIFQDDEKYARELARIGLGAWKFLDTHFGACVRGSEQRAPIVTLYPDEATWNSLRPLGSTTTAPCGLPFDLVAYDDGRAQGSRAYWHIVGGFARSWLRDRDPDLADSMPSWLDQGLDRLMRCAREKGGKLTFEPDHWEAIGIQAAENRGRIVPVDELLRDGIELPSGGGAEDRESYACQPSQLLRFLTVGAGAKDKKFARVLPEYLKNLRGVLDELRPELESAVELPTERTTRRDCEARMSARSRAWAERADTIRARVFERTFAEWTDADWKRFDAAYRATY